MNKNNQQSIKIILAGEGGHGVLTAAEILIRAGFKKGYQVTAIPNFGVEQRGGVALAFVQLSSQPINYPKFNNADLAFFLSARSLKRIQNHLDRHTKIFNGQIWNHLLVSQGLPIKSLNMVILGVITQLLSKLNFSVDHEIITNEIEQFFKEKPPHIIKDNITAFNLGQKFKEIKTFDLRKHPRAFSKKEIVYDRKIAVFPAYCKGCGACLYFCPTKALSWNTNFRGVYGEYVPLCDINKCIQCATCEHICPDGAIKTIAKE